MGFLFYSYKISDNEKIKLSEAKVFDLKDQPYIGNKQAKNIIVEFSDYRCPWCKKFQLDIYPKIKKELVDKGKLKFYYVNFTVLGSNSDKAANAAYFIYKQYPESFFAFHDALFKSQDDEKKNWVTNNLLINLAKKTVPDLNKKEFASIIKSEQYMKQVHSINSNAKQIGVKGTPTVFVNNKFVNALDYKNITKRLK
jgi:protein-disulfide isomerase